MGFWDGFGKYCGIQGLIALILVGVFAYAEVVGQVVDPSVKDLMLVVLGFYFGKNGVGIVQAVVQAISASKPGSSSGAGG